MAADLHPFRRRQRGTISGGAMNLASRVPRGAYEARYRRLSRTPPTTTLRTWTRVPQALQVTWRNMQREMDESAGGTGTARAGASCSRMSWIGTTARGIGRGACSITREKGLLRHQRSHNHVTSMTRQRREAARCPSRRRARRRRQHKAAAETEYPHLTTIPGCEEPVHRLRGWTSIHPRS